MTKALDYSERLILLFSSSLAESFRIFKVLPLVQEKSYGEYGRSCHKLFSHTSCPIKVASTDSCLLMAPFSAALLETNSSLTAACPWQSASLTLSRAQRITDSAHSMIIAWSSSEVVVTFTRVPRFTKAPTAVLKGRQGLPLYLKGELDVSVGLKCFKTSQGGAPEELVHGTRNVVRVILLVEGPFVGLVEVRELTVQVLDVGP